MVIIKALILLVTALATIVAGTGEVAATQEQLQLVVPATIELSCKYEPGMEISCEN